PHCGAQVVDRDLNAAMNIRDIAASYAGADPSNSSSRRVKALAQGQLTTVPTLLDETRRKHPIFIE
ncbi:MAG: hypothetical protein IKV42_05620, partial [Burkholderiaceae bacterium]|nr:hypothetical protein [Burkholderiaceae bacterium]